VRDRLAVCNFRLANVALDLEFALEPIDDDLQMKLAHARDDRLPSFLVREGTERRVFVRQLTKADTELVDVSLSSRFNRHRNDGVGELHSLENHGVLLVAERVPSTSIPQADRGVDVPRVTLLELFTLVRVHA